MPAHVFGWPIYSDPSVSYTPTFSSGSWKTTLPLTNLADRRLSRVARSTDATTGSTTFDVDLGVARAIGLLALPKHNLSTAATVRWRGSTVSNFASLVYDSGHVTAWPAGVTAEDVDGINMSYVVIPSSLQTARYWRCTITDTANAAGYVQLARVVIAGRWAPSVPATLGGKIGLESLTERIMSDGGGALYRSRPIRRYWDFTLSMLAESEAFPSALKMMRQLDLDGQVFFVWDSADTTYMHERAFLCVLRELTAIEYPFAALNSVPFRLLEEL